MRSAWTIHGNGLPSMSTDPPGWTRIVSATGAASVRKRGAASWMRVATTLLRRLRGSSPPSLMSPSSTAFARISGSVN
jgi:hypothetical protein